MMYSLLEGAFITAHDFALKSFVAVREAFSSAYTDKEVLSNATIHRRIFGAQEVFSTEKSIRRLTVLKG
jgi:hypothetical protein